MTSTKVSWGSVASSVKNSRTATRSRPARTGSANAAAEPDHRRHADARRDVPGGDVGHPDGPARLDDARGQRLGVTGEGTARGVAEGPEALRVTEVPDLRGDGARRTGVLDEVDVPGAPAGVGADPRDGELQHLARVGGLVRRQRDRLEELDQRDPVGQLRLGPLAVGDVAQDPGEVVRVPALPVRDGELEGEGAAVLSAPLRLDGGAARRVARALRLLEGEAGALLRKAGQQGRERLVDDLLLGVTEHLARGPVPGDDVPARVGRDDGVVRRLGDGTELELGLAKRRLDPLALADLVEHDDARHCRHAAAGEGVGDGERRPVGGTEEVVGTLLAADRHEGARGAGVGLDAGAVVQLVQVAPEQLVGVDSEHQRAGRVQVRAATVPVRRVHSLAGRLQDEP